MTGTSVFPHRMTLFLLGLILYPPIFVSLCRVYLVASYTASCRLLQIILSYTLIFGVNLHLPPRNATVPSHSHSFSLHTHFPVSGLPNSFISSPALDSCCATSALALLLYLFRFPALIHLFWSYYPVCISCLSSTSLLCVSLTPFSTDRNLLLFLA